MAKSFDPEELVALGWDPQLARDAAGAMERLANAMHALEVSDFSSASTQLGDGFFEAEGVSANVISIPNKFNAA
ncbi:MAG: hypothetical protein IT352_17235 [Gemmatimonadales bacterium]|nr:hypothetical protein [Gemmatimonadales bacterium]